MLRAKATLSVGDGQKYDVVIHTSPFSVDELAEEDGKALVLKNATFEFKNQKEASYFMRDFRANPEAGITINGKGLA